MNNKFTLLIEIYINYLPLLYLNYILHIFSCNIKNELKNNKFNYKKIYNYYSNNRISLKIFNINFYLFYLVKISNNIVKFINKKRKNNTLYKSLYLYIYKYNINNIKKVILLYLTKILINLILLKIIYISLIKIDNKLITHYSNFKNIKFIKNIKNILLLFNNNVIYGKLFNIYTTNYTYGNILFYNYKKIFINNYNKYPHILINTGKIIINHFLRKKIINKKINYYLNKLKGNIKINNIFYENISINEYPNILLSRFNYKFLTLPEEIIISILNKKKFIPIFKKGKITQYYFCNFNFSLNYKYFSTVLKNSENIINILLNESKIIFEYEYKIKNKLLYCLPKFKNIIFIKNYGNYYNKLCRLFSIFKIIYIKCKYKDDIIKNIIIMSKYNLITNLYFLLNSLKTTIFKFYFKKTLIKLNNNNISLYKVLKGCNLPLHFKGKISKINISYYISLSDKIDNLIGLFIFYNLDICLTNNDPFSLKYTLNSIFRIIIEKKIFLNLKKIFNKCFILYNKNIINKNILLNKLINYVFIRLKFFYMKKKISNDIINFIFLRNVNIFFINYNILEINNRINILLLLKSTNYKNKIFLCKKRILNILKIYNFNIKNIINKKINIQLFINKHEFVLYGKFVIYNNIINMYLKENKHNNVFLYLFKFCKYINVFFKKVIINDSFIMLKINRLILLKKIYINLFKFINI